MAPQADWLSQLRRGVLEFCILKVLGQGASYGYEIVNTLNGLGPLAAGESTVYPLLRRLKANALLETFMQESPSGPPRQYYRLSPAGQRRLTVLEKEWRAVVDAVDRCTREEMHREQHAFRARALRHST